MKKFLSIILVLAMLFAVASCGETDTPSSDISSDTVSEVVNDTSSEETSSVDETVPSNVALNKRTYCSSEVQTGFMRAVQVNDGKEDTSWSSDTTTENIDEWIAIDLGKNYDMDSITIKWGLSRATDYTVEISRGGVEYEEIHSAQGVTSTDPETITTDKVARYVRVKCTKVPSVMMGYMGATIKEIEVVGTASDDQTLGTETEQMTITKTVEVSEEDVLRGGRSYDYKDLMWAGSTYEFQCTGTAAGVVITGKSGQIEISVDGGEYKIFEVKNGTFEYIYSDKLEEGTHTVRVLRKSDPWTPKITIDAAVVEESADIVKGYKGNYDLKIEFIGDSITSGQGVNYNQCYTTQAAKILNAHFQVVSRSGMGLVRNAGNGKSELLPEQYQWTEYTGERDKPYTYKADVVVLNIGANDGGTLSKYITDPAEKEQILEDFEKAYYAMLDEILVANPGAAIVCAIGNLGAHAQIEAKIKKVVADYKNDHPEINIEYLRFEHAFDVTEETEGHPGPASHERDGKLLAEKIKEMLGK